MAFTDWEAVNSSHIDAARFDDENGTLQIRFKGGTEYEWYGVRQDQFEGLVNAPSPGRYLNSEIHGQFGAGHRI